MRQKKSLSIVRRLRRMQLVEGRGGRVVIGAEARGRSRGGDLFLLQTEEDGSEELCCLDAPDGDGWHQWLPSQRMKIPGGQESEWLGSLSNLQFVAMSSAVESVFREERAGSC